MIEGVTGPMSTLLTGGVKGERPPKLNDVVKDAVELLATELEALGKMAEIRRNFRK
jgi:hypothetical protein